jgi:hypothetical protein
MPALPLLVDHRVPLVVPRRCHQTAHLAIRQTPLAPCMAPTAVTLDKAAARVLGAIGAIGRAAARPCHVTRLALMQMPQRHALNIHRPVLQAPIRPARCRPQPPSPPRPQSLPQPAVHPDTSKHIRRAEPPHCIAAPPNSPPASSTSIPRTTKTRGEAFVAKLSHQYRRSSVMNGVRRRPQGDPNAHSHTLCHRPRRPGRTPRLRRRAQASQQSKRHSSCALQPHDQRRVETNAHGCSHPAHRA